MKSMQNEFMQLVDSIPAAEREEARLSFDIADRIAELMQERGLSKKQFAEALGRRPSEITKWLSGQHNFTLRTIAMISAFFGKAIISI